MTTAVVFAYHDVGVRCLLTLLARGVTVALVVTHEDQPGETIWFGSVRETARAHGIDVIAPASATSDELFAAVERVRPDFIFSFYYRHMLPARLLALASRGAYNMHGSLLPKYRGRVPVNWAILNGEIETGATLHEMAAKPDAGAIVAQTSVPILPDDTARDVFVKVTVAAEQTLWNVLPALVDGRAPRLPNDLANGSYFGGRKAEDGLIDWSASAKAIHDLVRAVAPPYPGATTMLGSRSVTIEETRRLPDSGPVPGTAGTLRVSDGDAIVVCGDGRPLSIVVATIDGRRHQGTALRTAIGIGEHRLGAFA